MIVLAIIALIAGAIAAFMFRRGGVYNPHMPSLDHLSTIPEPDVVPASVPPVQAPQSPKTAPQSVSNDHLIVMCTAIKDFEGANPANNNPGNCRCSPIGYLPKYGDVKCNPHNFAVFPSYELGWEYLQALVYHRVLLHPEWTFLDFFNSYAPSSDNNPTLAYATFVSNHCSVPVDSKVSVYLSTPHA